MATKHDIEHSLWYTKVDKIVLSRTIQQVNSPNTTILADNISQHITKVKQHTGKNILMFGSPTAAHTLTQFNLIDDYWLFVNPILLGHGIPMFAGIKERIQLTPGAARTFSSGVVGLYYESKSAT